MNFTTMTVEQLKEFLDENDVDYSEAKLKADLVKLAEQVEGDDDQTEPNSLIDKVQSAIKIERKETKKDDPFAYLADRDYGQLTVGERAMIRERSPEYENVDEGVQVTVTDRLSTEYRIEKLPNKKYVRFFKGKTYTVSQADYNIFKDRTVSVKTKETEDECCGNAEYEDVPLLEVAE